MLWKRSSPMTILDKFSTFFFKADRAILRCGGILIDKNWSNHVTFRYSYSGNILSSDPDPSQALPLGTYMPSSRRCLLSSFHIFAAGCASALATAHCSWGCSYIPLPCTPTSNTRSTTDDCAWSRYISIVKVEAPPAETSFEKPLRAAYIIYSAIRRHSSTKLRHCYLRDPFSL